MNSQENQNLTMTIFTSPLKIMPIIWEESVTKEETTKILTTTTLSLPDSKTENLSWQLLTFTAATLKTIMLQLDLPNTSVLL